MATTQQNPTFVGQLGQRLVAKVNNEGSIAFDELAIQYPEFAIVSKYALSFEVNKLAEGARIRLENRTGAIILHSVEL